MSQPLTFIHEDSRLVSLPVFRVKVKKTVKFNPFGEGKGAFRPAATPPCRYHYRYTRKTQYTAVLIAVSGTPTFANSIKLRLSPESSFSAC